MSKPKKGLIAGMKNAIGWSGKDKKNDVAPTPSKLFGAPLTDLRFMKQAISFISDHGKNVEGIFRVPGNQTNVDRLKQEIESSSLVHFAPGSDPNEIASLLKLWLRTLPEPLFTFSLYDRVIACARDKSMEETRRKATFRQILDDLPPINREALKILCTFLRDIASHASINKMNSQNLGTVFGPNSIRKAESDILEEAQNSQHAAAAMAFAIDHCDIFSDPNEQQTTNGNRSLYQQQILQHQQTDQPTTQQFHQQRHPQSSGFTPPDFNRIEELPLTPTFGASQAFPVAQQLSPTAYEEYLRPAPPLDPFHPRPPPTFQDYMPPAQQPPEIFYPAAQPMSEYDFVNEFRRPAPAQQPWRQASDETFSYDVHDRSNRVAVVPSPRFNVKPTGPLPSARLPIQTVQPVAQHNVSLPLPDYLPQNHQHSNPSHQFQQPSVYRAVTPVAVPRNLYPPLNPPSQDVWMQSAPVRDEFKYQPQIQHQAYHQPQQQMRTGANQNNHYPQRFNIQPAYLPQHQPSANNSYQNLYPTLAQTRPGGPYPTEHRGAARSYSNEVQM